MLNILLLLAGPSAFFNKEEYVFPKPLVEINGKSMIQQVIENLNTIEGPKRFICALSSEHCRKYHLDDMIKILTNNSCEIVYVEGETKGAVCTALLAIDQISPNDPLIIANPDQIIDQNLDEIVKTFQRERADAAVICVETIHPRWSYVRLNNQGKIIEAAEKRTISKHAIAGFYYFSKGGDFLRAASESIKKGNHLNGTYYVSLVLNELILEGKNLIAYHLNPQQYHTFYSPQKIEEYQKLVNHRVIRPSSNQMNIVIPMAGSGKRFEEAGYKEPKPFIDVAGKPMIARVIENLQVPQARYILLARREHLQNYPEHVNYLRSHYPVTFVEIDKLTEGTACTVLYARDLIDNNQPLMIANCDQIIDMNINAFIEDCFNRRLDGSILTFKDPHKDPKWSFAKTDQRGLVTEVQEKKAISDQATVGIYLFSEGKDFVNSAIDMIARNERVNNEFYTCPAYNYSIKNGKKIGVYTISFDQMHGIGTPQDLNQYLLCTASSH